MALVSVQPFDQLFVAREAEDGEIRQIGHGIALFLFHELPRRAFALPLVDGGKGDDERIQRIGGTFGSRDDVVFVHRARHQLLWLEFKACVWTFPTEVVSNARSANQSGCDRDWLA